MGSATCCREGKPSSGGGTLGQEFTDSVIQSMGPATSPRLRQIMAALIQHMHDFAREVQLTADEWKAAVELVNEAGRMSSATRNEGQLVCDVLGLETLLDDIANQSTADTDQPLTQSSILGPFWRSDAPVRDNGSAIVLDTPPDGQVAYMHGKVTSAATGLGIANAVVDVWQASTNGLYEQQDSNQCEYNLRGKFVTDAQGNYSFYCLRPTPYPIPSDGPAGRLLAVLDRHPWRPAHIHLIVEASGHKSLTTQIFDADSKYLMDDAAFAVKDGLTVHFMPRKNDAKAELELKYNVSLAVVATSA